MAPPLFTTESALLLDGPDWLGAHRRTSADAAALVPSPTPHDEEWRYSRVADLRPERFSLVTDPAPDVPPSVAALMERFGSVAGRAVTVDGHLVDCWLRADFAEQGVHLGPARDARDLAVGADHVDSFAAWNSALAASPLALEVPRNVVVDDPVVVVHHVSTGGGAGLARLVVRVGEAGSVGLVELHVGDDVEALSAPVTDVEVAPAARMTHTVVQDLGPRVWQVGSLRASVGQEASWSAAVAALGGDYSRMRVDCSLVGRGANGEVASTYLGSGDQMIDLRTFQDHVAPDTTSNLYFKGAVADRAHSVYTGLIRIHPGARGSNAVQSNRVVKLSDDAWAESVPNLEIENNDVRCAHASTVGPVDPDQRFYLESRGVPPVAAERLIVGGFFDEALDAFPASAAVDLVRSRIDAALDGGDVLSDAGSAR